MTMRWYDLPRRLSLVVALSALLVLAGCKKSDGLSDYERMKQGREGAANALIAKGAKVEEKQYPPHGSAWSVNLSGLTITDDMIKQVHQFERISELDLSKSTVTDAQLGLIQDLKISTYLLNLDLSHTAVTDAGFERLTPLGLLMQLNLTGTKVTKSAVDRFRQSRQTNNVIPNMFKNPNIKM